jgi:hypothetical protein
MWTQKIRKQGYVAHNLKSSLQKFYYHHHGLVDRYEISISQMTMNLLRFTEMFSFLYHCQDFDRTWLYIWVTRRVSYKKQVTCLSCASTGVHTRLFGGVHVTHLFRVFLFFPIMRLHVLSSVLWCPLRFLHKNDVRFVFTSSCL